MALNSEDVFKLRQKKSKAILERFREWLDELVIRVPPKSALGNAMAYTLTNCAALNIYLTNGYLRIDNNYIENKIRPFALGRRNWFFMGNARGAQSAANLLSMIESARANGLEPYYYLRFIFTKVPNCETDKQLMKRLPNLCDPLEIIKI